MSMILSKQNGSYQLIHVVKVYGVHSNLLVSSCKYIANIHGEVVRDSSNHFEKHSKKADSTKKEWLEICAAFIGDGVKETMKNAKSFRNYIHCK